MTRPSYKSLYQPPDYYAIQLSEGGEFGVETGEEDVVIPFTLLGAIEIEGDTAEEKSSLKLTQVSRLVLKAKRDAEILYLKSKLLNRAIAWTVPIVIKTEAWIRKTFHRNTK